MILNGTPAQLGYTVPFTLVHTGKYRAEDKLKTDTLQKLNTTQKKQTTQNTEQNYETRPGDEGRLILQSSRAHMEPECYNNTTTTIGQQFWQYFLLILTKSELTCSQMELGT